MSSNSVIVTCAEKSDIPLEDWTLVKGTVCEGCIYTRGISPCGDGCGRLFETSFRKKREDGFCDFRKTDLFIPSIAERKSIDKWKLYQRLEDPFKEPRQLVKDFIKEKLDGNIDALVNYDFCQLEGVERYGYPNGYAHPIYQTELVRAICTIVFDDIASKEVMFDKKSGTLLLHPSPLIPTTLWGTQMEDWFFMPAFFHCKESKALAQRIIPCASLSRTIGNLSLNPICLFRTRIKSDIDRIKIDYTLRDLYVKLVESKEGQASNRTKKKKATFYDPYYGKEGWDLLMRRLMTEDVLVDYYGYPEPFFDESPNPNVSAQTAYLKVLDQCLNLCYELIPNRSKRMVKRLSEKL